MSSFVNWIEKCFPEGDILRKMSDYQDDFSGEEWNTYGDSILHGSDGFSNILYSITF